MNSTHKSLIDMKNTYNKEIKISVLDNCFELSLGEISVQNIDLEKAIIEIKLLIEKDEKIQEHKVPNMFIQSVNGKFSVSDTDKKYIQLFQLIKKIIVETKLKDIQKNGYCSLNNREFDMSHEDYSNYSKQLNVLEYNGIIEYVMGGVYQISCDIEFFLLNDYNSVYFKCLSHCDIMSPRIILPDGIFIYENTLRNSPNIYYGDTDGYGDRYRNGDLEYKVIDELREVKEVIN